MLEEDNGNSESEYDSDEYSETDTEEMVEYPSYNKSKITHKIKDDKDTKIKNETKKIKTEDKPTIPTTTTTTQTTSTPTTTTPTTTTPPTQTTTTLTNDIIKSDK